MTFDGYAPAAVLRLLAVAFPDTSHVVAVAATLVHEGLMAAREPASTAAE